MASLSDFDPVHPHVRGENDSAADVYGPTRRFTPTCVGKTTLADDASGRSRFTPTCVGKTTATSWQNCCSSRFTPTCVGKTSVGPSGDDCPPRFTPTCVGKTSTDAIAQLIT